MATLFDSASLVMIPSGVKEDKLYSIKPTDGSGDFTFSRGSDIQATRVNASGLIEKAKENLILQSNQFDTTWVNTNTTETGGQTGYDGSSDAWLLDKSADFARITQSVTNNGVQTYSVYAKAGSLNYMRLRVLGTSNAGCFFDFTDGSVVGNDGFAASMVSVGGGWYRCSYTFDSDITEVQIFPANSGTSVSGGSGNIYIQDAQLNHGLIAQDYVETTTTAVVEGLTADLPRLDYSGGASCPSLLLEPQRSNINPYSEYFGTFWNGLGTETITSNYGVSPEGLSNATRFQATSAGRGGMYASIAVNNGTTYTLSFYAKSLSGTQKIRIGADNGCATPQGAETFEVTTEWQKFTKTITSTQGGWNLFFDNVESGTACTGTYLDCDMLVYGFQAEAGSYPTSYIPTYGTAANRGADDAIVNYTLSDTEGTLFYQGFGDVSSDSHLIALSNSTGAQGGNRILLYRSTADNKVWLYVQSASVTQVNEDLVLPTDANDKYAVAWANNDFAVYVNGTQVYTTSSGSVPTGMEYIQFNEWNTAHAEKNVTKQALYFDTRLTNAELAALTA